MRLSIAGYGLNNLADYPPLTLPADNIVFINQVEASTIYMADICGFTARNHPLRFGETILIEVTENWGLLEHLHLLFSNRIHPVDVNIFTCPAQHYGYKCSGCSMCPVKKAVRIPLAEDRRIFTPLARSSCQWKSIYKKRTSVERVNSRLDISFGFEEHFIRGLTKMKFRCSLALCVMLAMALGRIMAYIGFPYKANGAIVNLGVVIKTPKIISNPKVMLGKHVIEGTRITVEYILEELRHGQSFKALLQSHPTLTQEGIQAALDYAAKVLKSEVVYPD